MSNKQIFQVYHGPGNVRYGPTGVDLSDFIVSERGIDRPAERSVPSIKGWLMRGLRVDPQTSDITINVIVSRATEGFYWELMPVQNSRVWRWYLENALQRGWPLALVPFVHPKDLGVQTNMDDGEGPSAEVNETSVEEVNAREDGGVVAPVGIQPGGVADEGETVSAIVDEMEREDSDNERVEEGDSSDDETDINPAEWASEDFSGLIVSEEDSVRWEYKENEVIQGAIYSRAEDIKEAVKHFAVSLHKEFWVAKSNRSQYEVRCVKEKDGCPWRVHAYKGKWKDYWTVSVVTKHTCFLPGVQKYHRNITCAFVASEMYAHVIDNLTYEPRSIIRHIEETYKYTISYAKAWRAKQKIIEMRFGTYEASYVNLPRLLGVIEERNPGSSYEVKKFPSIEHPGKSVLQRAFLALHACKMAFVNCRPVLCIDGTFLTGKYRGQILTAIGVDGNNQVLPLAFAFVESENTDSWYWFLKLVKTKVVGMRPNSRWCMRHMGANFFKQFKNKELMYMFKRLCNQNQEKKFNELWKRLDELTAKCSDQRAAASSTAVADPPQALGPLPTDSPTLVRRTGLEIRKFSQWILHEPKEKWAKAYDTGGARYGVMTTNLAEVYNWVMRGVRGLPLVGIVEFILHGTCRYFRDRFQAVLPSMPNNSILFGAFMQKKLEELRKKAMKHRALVQGTQQHRFEILCQNKAGRGIYRKRVKQECVLKADGTCHCSCAKPKLLHRPCTHVIAAAAECGIPDAVYVSQYFSKQAIYHTWSGEIYGFGIAGEFTETNDEVLNIPDPSKLRGKAGRRRTRRIRNDMDESEAGRVKRCSKCDEHGHTYKHCPKDKEKPSAAEAGLSGSAADGARPTEMARQDTPQLLDPAIDHRHRSHLTVVQGAQLGTFWARTCGELLTVHDSFVERLREAGLLPMCRLVEAAAGDADPARRWTMDRSLLAALVDRSRPETHTFHLPCGEVAPTLQDVSYLLGLPLAGDAVGPVTTAVDWQDDLTARFALVQRAPHLPLELLAHHRNTGPTKRWLLQFTVEQLQAEADEYSYSRCLEAYLLWLFGWVMFCCGHGHAVDKGLVHYARSIADATVGEVPQWSWGSALLAALYRALCESCTKTDPSATFGGCPLFLSIWAADRIAIGRPEVDQHAYEESLYEERPEVDYPTMGTLWCRRQRRWAHVQVRRSYPEFVMEFDRLLPTDVVWEPYSATATQARAPLGLSTLCTRDQAYWMTTVPMVFDICVEPHAPFRVMRQFGFRLPFPVPFPTTVPAAVHRYSRKGQQSAGDWPAKLATFVEDWLLATEEVVDHEGEPHTEESYKAYLRWYQPRTRTRVTFAPLEQQPHVASTRDLYARHCNQDFARAVDDINRVVVDGSTTIQRLGAGIPVPVEEHLTTYTRMVESMRSILRVLTCRADDVARADAAVHRPPVPTGPRPAAHVPRPTPPPHGGFRAPFSTPPSSARPSVVPPTGFAQFAMTQAAHFSQAAGLASQAAVSTSHSAQFWQYTGTSSQAAGTSSQGPPLDHAGTSSDHLLPSTFLFGITDFDVASGSTEDVIDPSQLGGTLPVQTQDQAQATPPRDTRATRAVPPDRFTYSQNHVRAQARRTKRGRGAGQGQ
uniref:Transposon protein, putative, mutator sub-class n=2 Tax=Oryza sativa subsp. japonica TaxID=39947 RepID=Q2RAJ1_ORYSJ|nr:transposon protein, putative, mutator sub-class [Oryza sativa Japonica Group]ABA91495.1 transposon protein, putative, Mutator sub-class [Oryza sativa Japonica Group]